jgi:hypothetical protein
MEITKYITKKTMIYICIIIVIIIIFRILYNTFYNNENNENIEGFDLSNNPASDLLSKYKSADAQFTVNLNDTNTEMQIYLWSNKIYNLQKQQTKAISFYKPILMINKLQYAKLGDIVSQNTDYSLPSVDQFTLLIKKGTSDIKTPVRFDLIAEIDNPNFNLSYYEYSAFINESVNIKAISGSLNNCSSAINTINSLIGNNLAIIQKKIINKIQDSYDITTGASTTPLTRILKEFGQIENFDGSTGTELIEGFDGSEEEGTEEAEVTEVTEGSDNFYNIPPIELRLRAGEVLTSGSSRITKINGVDVDSSASGIVDTISAQPRQRSYYTHYRIDVDNIGSSDRFTIPSGIRGYILYKGNEIYFNIPPNLDVVGVENKKNILKKLPNTPFGKLDDSNIITEKISIKIFECISYTVIANFLISLCNDIRNIYNNSHPSKQSLNENLLSYLRLAPNIDVVNSLIDTLKSKIDSDDITSETVFDTTFFKGVGGLNIDTMYNGITLLELVIYIIKTMNIDYIATCLTFKIDDLIGVTNIINMDPSFIGCYKDSTYDFETEKDDVANRAIPNFLGRVDTRNGEPNAIKQCANAAYKKGYNIIGLQNGNECWGGLNPNYSKFDYSAGDCGSLGKPWVNTVFGIKKDSLKIIDLNNNISSNIPISSYKVLTNSTYSRSKISIINSVLLRINNFSQFINEFSNGNIDYFPLQIYKPIPPDNYISLGHVFCNVTTDLQKIIDSKNVACVPLHCVKEIRDWTKNDKIFEYNKNSKYFAIYFNPYTGTFISTNTNAQQLPDGKVCKVVACVKKCTAVEDLEKAEDCTRKYYNLNKETVTSTPLNSTLVSSQEEEFYLNKIKTQSDSITRLKQRAQKMQTDYDKANIVNREMNKNNLQNYVDVQKRNIDIIMKRLQDDKNKIKTNVNIPEDAFNELKNMIKKSKLISPENKQVLITKLDNSQNLSGIQYNNNLNQVLSSCPQYDLSELVSKKTASDVCFGCDTPI